MPEGELGGVGRGLFRPFSREYVANLERKIMQLSFRWRGYGFGHPPETWWAMELRELDRYYAFLHAELAAARPEEK